MSVTKNQFVMRNYVGSDDFDNSIASSNTNTNSKESNVHTELTLKPNEFEHFTVDVETNLTFCLKELRALMAFADSFSFPLTAQYDAGGCPVVFSIHGQVQGQLEAALVMATIGNDGEGEVTKPTTTTTTVPNGIKIQDHHIARITDYDNRMSEEIIDNLNATRLQPESVHESSEMLEQTVNNDENAPPPKRARFFFKRCFEATFNPSDVPGHEKVLAPDSDEDV